MYAGARLTCDKHALGVTTLSIPFYRGVIPKPGVFSSRARDLACSGP